MSDRPGVMFYFDSIRPALRRLDDAQCGVLLRAVVDYAELGVVPELDAMTGMVFEMIVPKIDRDAEKYEESREQRQYAAYSRETKRRGEQPMSVAEWKLARYSKNTGRNGPSQSFTENQTPSPSISVSPSISISPSISVSGEVEGEGYKGEGEGEHMRVYCDWLRAMDNNDRDLAYKLFNRLYVLGYDADLKTRELRKRNP